MLHRSTHMLPHASHCAHSRDASLHGFVWMSDPSAGGGVNTSRFVSGQTTVSRVPERPFRVLSRVFCMLASGRKVLALVAFFHQSPTHGCRGASVVRTRLPRPEARPTHTLCVSPPPSMANFDCAAPWHAVLARDPLRPHPCEQDTHSHAQPHTCAPSCATFAIPTSPPCPAPPTPHYTFAFS